MRPKATLLRICSNKTGLASPAHFYHLFHVFVAATVGFQVQNTVGRGIASRLSAWRRYATLTMNNERFAALVTLLV